MTQPTEPIPYVPPPPRQRTSRTSWLRGHARSIAAIVAAVAVVAAAVWFAVTAALSNDSTWTAESASPAVTVSTPPAAAATPTGAAASAGARTIVRAVIVNQSGPTWTVRTRAGAQTKITIAPRNRFAQDGTAAASSQFQPGDDVVILAAVTKGSVTADWIVTVRPHRSAASASP